VASSDALAPRTPPLPLPDSPQGVQTDQVAFARSIRVTAATRKRTVCTLSLGASLGVSALSWWPFGGDKSPSGDPTQLPPVPDAGPVIDAELAFAPNVPPPINRTHPVTLRVRLTSEVVVKPLTKRFKFTFWTFNGSVPGPMIRARVGDTMELTHVNLDPTGMAHNIDFHGVSGPGGGAPLTYVEKGEERVSRFKLLNPGLYVYHCAAAPLPIHVANGMYGLLLVEPEEGMTHGELADPGCPRAGTPLQARPRILTGGARSVDKEFYVMQSEFYFEPPTDGGVVIEESSYLQGMREQPEAVVFNGEH
jgi:FtsP/CotA-like multicopper oxidase with cupredoxin domain